MVSALLDLVYPPRCGLCGVFGCSAVCASCLSEFVPGGAIVTSSLGPIAYRVHLYRYESRGAQAVRRLKYDRITSLASPLADLLREGYEQLAVEPDVVVPVPIHWRRRTMRGFNQAEALCTTLPLAKVRPELLKRVRATKPQVGLGRDERRRNLVDAFRASPLASGLSVLLVDDVSTSGHTAEECAKALLAQGAVEVGLLTLTGEA